MYNALATDTSSRGSTRLHMDMSDALNIMTYASARPDGSKGSAVWDLFRREDTSKVHAFLRQATGQPILDSDGSAIHSQEFYLTDSMRAELFETCGVRSYRVHQRPGDAVIIPAGCGHQVQ